MTKMTVKSSRMSLEVLIKKGLVKRLALTTNRKSLRYKYALESASIEVKDLEFIPPANSPKEKKSYIDRNPETTQYAFRESDGKRYNTDQNQRMNINNPSIVLKSDYNVEDIKSFIKSHGYKSLKNKFKVFLLLKEKSEEEIVQLTANEILSEIKKTDKKLKITLNTISRICRDLTSEGIFEKTCGENIKTGHKIGFYSIP